LLRSLIFYFVFFTTLIFISIVIILTSFFVTVEKSQIIASSWIVFILRILSYVCGIGWIVSGIENMPEKPFIMMANHQGPWESLFLQTLTIPTSSIIKKEILFIPFFGWAIARLNPIPINRKEKHSSMRKIIKLGGDRIKDGYAVLIFPEGTRRNADDGIGRFGNGGSVLAINEGVPVVPICHNSGMFWKNRSLKKVAGKISVVIGQPINGNNAKEITKKAQLWINETYKEIS
jgi:1-acyl-sn-glycerol-3-phosphate acyltransferase